MARSKTSFPPGKSGNPSGKARTDAAPADGVRVTGGTAMDGFINLSTGLGLSGRDKTRGTVHETDCVSPEEGLDLWRGNDVAARMVETVVDEACRVGFDFQVTNAEDEKYPQPDAPPANLKPPSKNPQSGEGAKVLPFKRKDAIAEEGEEEEAKAAPKPGEKPEDDAKDLSERMVEAWEKLQLLERCREAGHHQRAAGGGALLLGADDGARNLAAPLNLEKVKKFEWVNFLELTELSPEYWYNDPFKPNYRQVAIWRHNPSQPGQGVDGETGAEPILIHESRLIIFQGILTSRIHNMPNRPGWGDSIFVRARQVLSDYSLTWSSLMVLLQEQGMAVFKMKGLSEAFAVDRADGGGAAQGVLRNRLAAMSLSRGVTNTTVIDAGSGSAEDDGESFERVAVPLTGVSEIVEQMLQRVAACAGLTVAELFGIAPSGLNASGDGDQNKKYESAGNYQKRWLIPAFRRVAEILLALWKEAPDAYTIKPRPLVVPTDKERAEVLLSVATADEKNIAAGVYTPEEVAASRYGGDEFSLDMNIDFEAREAGIPAAPGPAKTEQQLEQEAAEADMAAAELEIAAKKAEPRPLAKRDNVDCDDPIRDGDGRFAGCASGGGGGGGGSGGGGVAAHNEAAAALGKEIDALNNKTKSDYLPDDVDEIEAVDRAERRLELASYDPAKKRFVKVEDPNLKVKFEPGDPYEVSAAWSPERSATARELGLGQHDPMHQRAAIEAHLKETGGDKSFSADRQAAAVEAYKAAHQEAYRDIVAARDRAVAANALDKRRSALESAALKLGDDAILPDEIRSGVDVGQADRLLTRLSKRLGQEHVTVAAAKKAAKAAKKAEPRPLAKRDGACPDCGRMDCANPSRDGNGRFTGCQGGGGGGSSGGGGGPALPRDAEWARSTFGEARAARTPEQVQAAKSYQSSGFVAVNDSLRGTVRDPLELEYMGVKPGQHNVDAITKGLDAQMVAIPDSAMVYRGLRDFDTEDIKVGDVLSDPAFMSTSLDKGVAQKFATHRESTFMEIELPAGTRAAHLGETSITESELLLARGTSLKVTGITTMWNGQKVLRVRAESQGAE